MALVPNIYSSGLPAPTVLTRRKESILLPCTFAIIILLGYNVFHSRRAARDQYVAMGDSHFFKEAFSADSSKDAINGLYEGNFPSKDVLQPLISGNGAENDYTSPAEEEKDPLL